MFEVQKLHLNGPCCHKINCAVSVSQKYDKHMLCHKVLKKNTHSHKTVTSRSCVAESTNGFSVETFWKKKLVHCRRVLKHQFLVTMFWQTDPLSQSSVNRVSVAKFSQKLVVCRKILTNRSYVAKFWHKHILGHTFWQVGLTSHSSDSKVLCHTVLRVRSCVA
jgi:hypothetical protein